MARGFLIFLNIVVLLFYLTMFILLEPLLNMVSRHIILSSFMLNSLKFFLLAVAGFCMGSLTQFFTRTAYQKTFWDIKGFLLLSIIPILFLVMISIDPVMETITKLPVIRENSSEFLFYLISSKQIWILWIGLNLGTSIKFPQFYMPKRAKKARQ